MPVFLISAGNSDSGPVGYVARVSAPDAATALARLKEQIPDSRTVSTGGDDIDDLQVYFNTDFLTIENVIESETEDDDAEGAE